MADKAGLFKSVILEGSSLFPALLTNIQIRRQIFGQQIRHHPLLHGQAPRRPPGQFRSYARVGR